MIISVLQWFYTVLLHLPVRNQEDFTGRYPIWLIYVSDASKPSESPSWGISKPYLSISHYTWLSASAPNSTEELTPICSLSTGALPQITELSGVVQNNKQWGCSRVHYVSSFPEQHFQWQVCASRIHLVKATQFFCDSGLQFVIKRIKFNTTWFGGWDLTWPGTK